MPSGSFTSPQCSCWRYKFNKKNSPMGKIWFSGELNFSVRKRLMIQPSRNHWMNGTLYLVHWVIVGSTELPTFVGHHLLFQSDVISVVYPSMCVCFLLIFRLFRLHLHLMYLTVCTVKTALLPTLSQTDLSKNIICVCHTRFHST